MTRRHPASTIAVRRGRRLRRSALAAAVLLLAACTPAPDARAPMAVADRWIPDEPFELFDPAGMLATETVLTWRPWLPEELSEWKASGLEPLRANRSSVVLEPTGPDPRLERRVRLVTAEVDVIEVDLRGVRGGRVELFWARAGQSFSEGRRIGLPWSHGVGGRTTTYAFPVGLHPEWRGTIARLRIDPATSAARTLRLEEIRATRWAVTDAATELLTGQPWKVRIGDDVRTARLAAGDRPWEREVEVRRGDVLRLGFGLPAAARTGTRFTISVADGDSAPSVVLDRRLGPAGDRARWRDVRVPLDRFAGARVRIRLAVEPAGKPDPVRDLAAWSDPVLLRPTAAPAVNVVMICLDTLRADRMSLYGHDRETTPMIDAWAATRAVAFDRVVAPAPWTLPAHVSLFTGLDAPHHGVNHTAAAPAELDLLAEQLRRAGRVTAAVTGGGILRPRYRFTQGFDSFAYWDDESSARELDTGVDRTLSWLDDHADEPFFLFFHTYEVHYPHRRRQPYFDRLYPEASAELPSSAIQMRPGTFEDLVFTGDRFVARSPGSDDWRSPLTAGEIELVRAMYDSAIAYADSAVGRLLERLDRLGLRDRTLVVLLSDHGEALGEDGHAGHSYLEDYNLLVPLVIELPGGRAGGARVPEQVRLVDVAPTVLDAVGAGIPAGLDGVSLLPAMEGERGTVPTAAAAYAASANRGLALRFDDRVKLVVNNVAWRSLAGKAELYDIAADPGERNDIAGTDPRTAELDATAFELLERTHAGLRLRIANRSAWPLHARLTGAWRDQTRVKTLDPGCRCVFWDEGDARIVLDAGSEVTLVVEGQRDRQAGIDGSVGPVELPFDHDIDIGSIDGAQSLRWTAQGWNTLDGPLGTDDTGFQMWRVGPRPAELSDSRTGADEALEQLRALGYVE